MYRKRDLYAILFKTGIFILFIFLATSCRSTKESTSISEEERDYYINYLKENLGKNSYEPGYIHLAEYLVDLQYGQNIYDSFSNIDLTLDSVNSSFRCGVYRVLALSSQSQADRDIWVQKINDMLGSGNIQDQILAAESLAKIGLAPVSSFSGESVDTITNSRLRIFLQWSCAFRSEKDKEEIENLFVNNCIDTSADAEVRRLSAYALGYNLSISAEQQNKMQKAAMGRDTGPLLQKYLVWSSYILSTDQKNDTSIFYKLKTDLTALSKSGIASDRYLMATAFARNGKAGDINLIKAAFSRESELGRNEDVLSALAFAILKIDRNEPRNLSTLDWGVVIAYFIMMVLIGVYYSKKNKSFKDFALGGKSMGAFSIGLSLFATMLSSLSYLSYPGEMIRYGPIIFAGMFAFPITHWVVGWFIIPKFMKEDVSSAYELLEKKLGVSIRLMASFLFIALRFLWMATVVFATVDTAIGAIFDISPLQRFIFGFILLVITLFYSSIGGLKAVVMTDVIQTFLLWIGAILTIVIVSFNLGSFSSWIPDHWLSHWSPLRWGFNATERSTVGNAILMLFVWYICTAGSDQMAIQRYLATRDLKAARKSFGIALLSNLVVKILLGLVGLALMGFFFKNPHLLKGGKTVLEQADNFFPRFIVVGFPLGIAGLVFAGLLAAAMSSLSGGLNSTAVVISEDWLKRFRKKKSTKDEVTRIKLLSVSVGFVVLLLSFVVGFIHGNLFDIVQKTANLFVAPLFVLFFMALFIPFSTERGTLIAGLSSVFFAMGIAYFEFMGIKSLWIMTASLIFGIVVGVIASYVEVLLLRKRHV